jgi:hypothetical protein
MGQRETSQKNINRYQGSQTKWESLKRKQLINLWSINQFWKISFRAKRFSYINPSNFRGQDKRGFT